MSDRETATFDPNELRAFNEQRKKLVGGKPITPDKRLPLDYTNRAGDVEPHESDDA